MGGMNRGGPLGPQGSYTCSVPHSHQVLQPGPSTCLTNGPANGQWSAQVISTGPTYPPNIQGQDLTAQPHPLHVPLHQGGAGAGWSGGGPLATPHGSIPGLHTLTAALGKSLNLSVSPSSPAGSCRQQKPLPPQASGDGQHSRGLATWARSPGCSTCVKTPSCEVRHSSDPTSLSAPLGLTLLAFTS